MMLGTPRLSNHARARCSQMGISTKRAKRVVQNRTMTYRGKQNNAGLVCMSADTDISVVWDPHANIILTVLPRVSDEYVRTADGYAVVA